MTGAGEARIELDAALWSANLRPELVSALLGVVDAKSVKCGAMFRGAYVHSHIRPGPTCEFASRCRRSDGEGRAV